jgi:hypothetical protein
MSYSHCAGDCVVPYLQLGSAPATMYAYQAAERKVRHCVTEALLALGNFFTRLITNAAKEENLRTN